MSVDSGNGDPISVPDPDFYSEAVVVCDQYSDFLRVTLPQNKHIFDRIVVVTPPEDRATQRICEFHHVECVQTDRINSRWRKFCKGAGVNAGLALLSKKAWVVHIDADIWLPPQTRMMLQAANLDKAMVYGIDRFIVKGFKAWDRFLQMPRLQHECGSYVHVDAFPVGTRVTSNDAGGYVPIGFFQMWCPVVTGISVYPEEHTDAGRGDMAFAKKWKRSQRGFIPEVIAYHLESADSSNMANWGGRKTAPFTFEGDQT